MTEETSGPRPSRRDELVQVALTVLERDGFAHLSIGEVARLDGIKPPSLYKQFESKADIEASLITYGHELLAERFERCAAEMPEDATYRDRVDALMSTLREFGLAHPQLYLLINSRPFPSELLGPVESYRGAQVFFGLVPGQAFAASVWAWAHGILSLEIVAGLPKLVSPDAPWSILVDTVVARSQEG